jgi:hypothetical protein
VPIPGTLKDLREILGLPEGMKGHVSEAAAQLVANHSIGLGKQLRGGGAVIYPEQDPTTFEEASKVPGTGNLKQSWNIGRFPVPGTLLPADPEARQAAIQWLNTLNGEWNADLKTLRAKYRNEVIAGLKERGMVPPPGTGQTATSPGVPETKSRVAQEPKTQGTGNPGPAVPADSEPSIISVLKEKKSRGEETTTTGAPTPDPEPVEGDVVVEEIDLDGPDTEPEDPTPEPEPAPAEAVPSEELVVVARIGIPVEKARSFLAECRTAYPECTIDDIVAVIDQKIHEIRQNRNIYNPAGVLLTSVPQRLLAAWQEKYGTAKGARA